MVEVYCFNIVKRYIFITDFPAGFMTTSSIGSTDSTILPSDKSNWHWAIYPSMSTMLTVTDGLQQLLLQINEEQFVSWLLQRD